MFLIVLNYIKPVSEAERFLAEHREFLERYYASGHFLLSGRQVPRTGGVILAVASTREEVERIIAEDPFHREQIASFTVIEFVPTMAAAPLEGLRVA